MTMVFREAMKACLGKMEVMIKAGQKQLRVRIKPGLDEIKTTEPEANREMLGASGVL
jgi:hypothetical protein